MKPVCCKVPRYGPHKSRIITKLVEGLKKNGVIEDEDGPWGSQVVLAAKPNQGQPHWANYIWHLCMSYRTQNTVT